VIPADKEAVQPMIDALHQQYGFVAQPGSLTITGLCEECAVKQ
jgi:Fe2+ or Zn2+ uptake regulation protein